MKEVAGLAQSLTANIERVIVGKRGQITLSLVALQRMLVQPTSVYA